ncbi:MAG: molybdopterin dinucleotide binding domain-containing protein, partial [Myxococcota bacterium]
LWGLTGNLGKKGAQYIITPFSNIASGRYRRDSPVAGARIIGGLVPCNVIAEEILSDHDKRYRAMIVEASNPAHSLADSKAMREALASLDTLVVIDVAMTETAKLADYVLPASTQYEKAEATFFNAEFPKNYFHLRPALLEAPEGPLPEAEIHARLVDALGALDHELIDQLRSAAEESREAFTTAFTKEVAFNPKHQATAAVILYRTLGEVLPPRLKEGAVLWGLALQLAAKSGPSLARAGFSGPPAVAGNQLFDALVDNPSGIVFAVDEWDDQLGRVQTKSKKLQLALPDLLEELARLDEVDDVTSEAFPLVLSAGERRSFTANTIVRDPAWRKKDAKGALRISPDDAEGLGVSSGDRVRLVTERGELLVEIEVSTQMQPGHISLPNGMGLGENAEGQGGVAPNELTASAWRDPFVGTPWHKRVPARVEALA